MAVRKMSCGIVGLILVASMQGCGQSEESKSAAATASVEKMNFSAVIQPEDILGTWTAGTGQATVDKLPDGSFKLINENKGVATGKIDGGKLDCKDWNVIGQLSLDKKTLVWSNGFVWQR